jgi:hypothetical protein
VDWLVRFIKTGEMSVDFVLKYLQSYSKDIEILGKISRASITSEEYLLKSDSGRTFNIQNLRDIDGAKIIDLETISPVGNSHGLSVEELLKLSTTNLIVAINNGGVVKNSELNIEYDGVVFVTNAHDIWILGPNPTSWTLSDGDNSWRLTK